MRRILLLALLCSSVFAYGQQAEARLERLRAKSQHATAIQYLKRTIPQVGERMEPRGVDLFGKQHAGTSGDGF